MEIEKTSNPGGDGWVTKLLEQHLDNTARAHANYRRKKTIRPSEMGECTRKIAYDILNFPADKVPEPKLQRIFGNGHKVHSRYLKDYLPKLGIPCKVWIKKRGTWKFVDFIEVMIEDKKLWIRGAPDAIIFNPETGTKYVFELKSMNQESFWRLTDPLIEHVYQVHLYMHLTGLRKSILLYENKNRQDIKEFEVDYDQGVMDYLIQKIKIIQKHVNEYEITHKLPEREYDPDDCKYCKFAFKPTGCLSDWKKRRKN